MPSLLDDCHGSIAPMKILPLDEFYYNMWTPMPCHLRCTTRSAACLFLAQNQQGWHSYTSVNINLHFTIFTVINICLIWICSNGTKWSWLSAVSIHLICVHVWSQLVQFLLFLLPQKFSSSHSCSTQPTAADAAATASSRAKQSSSNKSAAAARC